MYFFKLLVVQIAKKVDKTGRGGITKMIFFYYTSVRLFPAIGNTNVADKCTYS
jgi:hypothetical protein